ncbi:hypothetical protein HK104_008681 [Borealophlyctis nickersoniae]|nr:hypothetical protein HK104_008681 [Borealophlyctis nickersoniae]
MLFSGPQPSMTGRNIPYEDEEYFTPPPGPASYNPKVQLTVDRSPAFSIQGRTKAGGVAAETLDTIVPGPGSYTPRDRQIRGNDAPKATLKSRWKSTVESTPGPADYTVAPTTGMSVAQLARVAAGVKKPDATSAVTPATTTPGPADYTPGKPSTTRNAGPRYSLGKRLGAHKGKIPFCAYPVVLASNLVISKLTAHLIIYFLIPETKNHIRQVQTHTASTQN